MRLSFLVGGCFLRMRSDFERCPSGLLGLSAHFNIEFAGLVLCCVNAMVRLLECARTRGKSPSHDYIILYKSDYIH